MSTNNDSVKPKLVAARRSSLKSSDINSKLDPESLLKLKNKRNSVSWGQSNTFQFKAMKAMFQESKDIEKTSKEAEEKHQKFVENRKKSIKNEFSIVKELMKNKNIIEEDDQDEEVKKNTDKNIQIGHDALNEESESDSHSNSHSDNEEEEEEEEEKEKEKEEEKEKEKEEEKEKVKEEKKEKEKENENEKDGQK